jgi:hypothetical protein
MFMGFYVFVFWNNGLYVSRIEKKHHPKNAEEPTFLKYFSNTFKPMICVWCKAKLEAHVKFTYLDDKVIN